MVVRDKLESFPMPTLYQNAQKSELNQWQCWVKNDKFKNESIQSEQEIKVSLNQ
jgi:hypothetical protein